MTSWTEHDDDYPAKGYDTFYGSEAGEDLREGFNPALVARANRLRLLNGSTPESAAFIAAEGAYLDAIEQEGRQR